MKRFLKKILVLGILLLVAAFTVDAALTAIFRKGRTVKAQWLHNMQGQHHELLVLGSSRAWWNIDVNEINRQCGISGISMANNHFTPSEMLLALKVFLRNGNTTDRVLMQVDYHNMRVEQDEFSSTVYDHLPWLKEDLVYEHLLDRSDEWKFLRLVPAARYVKYNFRWGPEEALITLFDKRRTIFDSTGSFFIDRPYKGWPYMELERSSYEMHPDFKAILELCESNSIQVDLFMAPYYRLRTADENRHDFDKLMNEHRLQVHNYFDRFDSTIYFDNNWHLSLQGGQIFTQMLIEDVICPADRYDPQVQAVQQRTSAADRPSIFGTDVLSAPGIPLGTYRPGDPGAHPSFPATAFQTDRVLERAPSGGGFATDTGKKESAALAGAACTLPGSGVPCSGLCSALYPQQ
jgi:hypothetical protein